LQADRGYGEGLSVHNECHGGRGKYIFDSGRTQGIGGVFQAQSEERQY